MKTLAKLRRGVYPQPVYEAHFSDGTVQRMSFFSEKGKPLDANRGRKLINAVTGWQVTHLPTFCRVAGGALLGKRLVRGFVEHDLPGKPWVRFVDPHFTPHVVEAKPKRITAKLAKDTLADLLDWLDGDGPDDALDRARELLAA